MTERSPAWWLSQARVPLATWLGQASGFFEVAWPGAWLVAAGGQVADANCLVLTDGGETGRHGLEAGLAELTRRGLPGVVAVSAELDGELADSLAGRGAKPDEVLRHELIELSTLADPVRTGIAIRTAEDETDFAAAMGLLAETFRYTPEFVRDTFSPLLLSQPGLTIRIAERDGEPAAVAVTHRRGELVYLLLMGTAAAYRRRGIGRDLLVRALAAERAAGGRWAHLVSSEVGAYLYRGVGFRRIADHPTYIVEPGS